MVMGWTLLGELSLPLCSGMSGVTCLVGPSE
jgi:biotin transporter BioY